MLSIAIYSLLHGVSRGGGQTLLVMWLFVSPVHHDES